MAMKTSQGKTVSLPQLNDPQERLMHSKETMMTLEIPFPFPIEETR